MARDTKGAGAKLVTFEALAPDGSAAKLEMLLFGDAGARSLHQGGRSAATRARQERYAVAGRRLGAGRPAGRLRDFRNMALQGDKGELYLWEEAKECPKGALPKYEAKVDKKPPPLVGR